MDFQIHPRDVGLVDTVLILKEGSPTVDHYMGTIIKFTGPSCMWSRS